MMTTGGSSSSLKVTVIFFFFNLASLCADLNARNTPSFTVRVRWLLIKAFQPGTAIADKIPMMKTTNANSTILKPALEVVRLVNVQMHLE